MQDDTRRALGGSDIGRELGLEVVQIDGLHGARNRSRRSLAPEVHPNCRDDDKEPANPSADSPNERRVGGGGRGGGGGRRDDGVLDLSFDLGGDSNGHNVEHGRSLGPPRTVSELGIAQHSTAQHSTAQHSTAPGIASHNTMMAGGYLGEGGEVDLCRGALAEDDEHGDVGGSRGERGEQLAEAAAGAHHRAFVDGKRRDLERVVCRDGALHVVIEALAHGVLEHARVHARLLLRQLKLHPEGRDAVLRHAKGLGHHRTWRRLELKHLTADSRLRVLEVVRR
eukprot:3936716-Rhodomonas_salina.4